MKNLYMARNIIIMVVFTFLILSCQKNENIESQDIDTNIVLNKDVFKSINSIKLLKEKIEQTTNNNVVKIEKINYTIDDKLGTIAEVIYKSDDYIKNIVFISPNVKTKLNSETETINKDYKNANILQPSGTDTYWCDNCEACYVHWNTSSGVISCSKSCCILNHTSS